MPNHSHVISIASAGNHRHKIKSRSREASEATTPGGGWDTPGSYYTEYDGTHTHVATASATGNNVKHNNMPPYEVIYRWKRTA